MLICKTEGCEDKELCKDAAYCQTHYPDTPETDCMVCCNGTAATLVTCNHNIHRECIIKSGLDHCPFCIKKINITLHEKSMIPRVEELEEDLSNDLIDNLQEQEGEGKLIDIFAHYFQPRTIEERLAERGEEDISALYTPTETKLVYMATERVRDAQDRLDEATELAHMARASGAEMKGFEVRVGHLTIARDEIRDDLNDALGYVRLLVGERVALSGAILDLNENEPQSTAVVDTDSLSANENLHAAFRSALRGIDAYRVTTLVSGVNRTLSE